MVGTSNSYTKDEFASRRNWMMKQMMEDQCDLMILDFEDQRDFSEGKAYPHYLARWLNLPLEGNFTYIIRFLPDVNRFDQVLWIDQKDPIREMWTGYNLSLQQAQVNFRVNRVQSSPMHLEVLSQYLDPERSSMVYYWNLSINPESTQVDQLIQQLEKNRILMSGKNLFSPEPIFDQARLIKSPSEIRLIQAACNLSTEAHADLIKLIAPKVNERCLEGNFRGFVISNGGDRPAYCPIIGSGLNSTILHYTRNNRFMEDGDLVLIDAGAEVEGYASDVTRTYPVNGQFTPRQKEIYSLVLSIQKQLINLVRPGSDFDLLQTECQKLITQGLRELGLLHGSFDQLIADSAYKKFFHHEVGHWLGLKVHDCHSIPTVTNWSSFNLQAESESNSTPNTPSSSNEEAVPFQPGMVITVEPGIYIGKYVKIDAHVNMDKYRQYYGIGVRIEDVVVVTERGCCVLTENIPKEMDQVEKLVMGLK